MTTQNATSSAETSMARAFLVLIGFLLALGALNFSFSEYEFQTERPSPFATPALGPEPWNEAGRVRNPAASLDCVLLETPVEGKTVAQVYIVAANELVRTQGFGSLESENSVTRKPPTNCCFVSVNGQIRDLRWESNDTLRINASVRKGLYVRRESIQVEGSSLVASVKIVFELIESADDV